MVDVHPVIEDIGEFQERPPSEQLVELHLYLVPKEKWLEKRKLAKNQAVDHTISIGFVRVLPHTVLADLRREMDRQLGIESVPQNFVFLRSVGRNFTQVRPKQEMEMKVKNYMPPFAPEPELFLKEGTYTGPNTWSQGEDSGLEESLADTNSQRSRGTPESLTDDQLVLPKLSDFLDLPDLDEACSGGCMPPGAMTVSMSADDLTAAFTREVARKGTVRQPNKYSSSEDVRYRRIRERQKEGVAIENGPHSVRGAGSWNRRQKRGTSTERGGAQLPTWAETRTTRLRRSRALGETNAAKAATQKKQAKKVSTAGRTTEKKPAPPPQHSFDAAEDVEGDVDEEDTGKVLMERIRANSRCLKAQISAHSRRTVADTGTASSKERMTPSEPRKPGSNGKVNNGVYTMHARKNLRGGAGAYTDDAAGAEIEGTTIQLVDEQGNVIQNKDSDGDSPGSDEAPEIVHQHALAANGVDGRPQTEDNENLSNLSEQVSGNSEANKSPEQIPDSDGNDVNSGEELNAANNLKEGRQVNKNEKLTIEVEVKEMGGSEESERDPTSATVESNLTPILLDDTGEYDSYRVYSEQNLLTPSTDQQPQETSMMMSPYNRRASRTDVVSKTDAVRLNRAKEARGVYLRRMEHRNNQAIVPRTQSNDRGLDSLESNRLGAGGSPQRRLSNRSVSQSRKSSKNRLEKWSTTAASTGDLADASWDYADDKDRLVRILQEIRGETRLRQRQREELLRKIKQLQSRAHQRREQVREMWRKRYLEAKKITPRLEEECGRLRQELEKLHRELLAKVQAGVWALLTISGKTERPSNKLSYKIMIARLLQEIEDLTRRVENTRLKLHTEVKLRSMAEKDVRNLREELLKKKIQVTLTRNQEQAALGNELRQQYFISAV